MTGMLQALIATAGAGAAPAPTLPTYSPGTYEIELSHGAYDSLSTFFEAYVQVNLFSDGTGEYVYGDSDTPYTSFASFTWLPAGGNAADYYAYMDTPAGDSFNAGSDSVATSCQLSTDRYWVLDASVTVAIPGDSGETAYVLNSTLRIKNSGGTDLVAKTIYMASTATVGTL